MCFLLQARGVNDGVGPLGLEAGSVMIATQQVIGFCPGCGVRLQDFYDGRLDSLRSEALVIR